MCRVPLSSLALLGLLSLAGCKPKPTHEIGHVEYDKLMTWKDMAKLGREGAKKMVGKTITFTELDFVLQDHIDPTRDSSCLAFFYPNYLSFADHDSTLEVKSVAIGVLVNFGQELKSWLTVDPHDTTLSDLSGIKPVKIDQFVCGACRGSDFDHDLNKYTGGTPVDSCLFQRHSTLFITGTVIAVGHETIYGGIRLKFHIMPTGIAW
jgi:hypothetical protein